MNELFPDANRANDIRRLNILWHSMLPGAIVIVIAVLYALTRGGAYAPPAVEEPLAAYLPVIFAAGLFFGIGLALFLKPRLPGLVARNVSDQPFQRASAAMFTLAGAADAPAIIGLGIYMMMPADWLAAAIAFYAIAAGVLFKPDFGALLAVERREFGARG
ncbi:MAG TPA: hypothetical protein VF254_00610 [Gammaproteobacteria bacterium]